MEQPNTDRDTARGGLSAGIVARRRADRVAELQGQIDRSLHRLRVAVIYGGNKAEEGAVINPTINPRSWKSYQAVAEDIANSLKRIGFKHVYLTPDDMRLGERLRELDIHMGWLNTGGVQGYHSVTHAPAMLEMFGIPYVGHDPLTSGVLDNKHVFKRNLKGLGIPTAPSVTWSVARGPFQVAGNAKFQQAFVGYDGPFIVKPVSGRASLLIEVVKDIADLAAAVTRICEKTENHVLIESFLPGREFCVAVCGPVVARNGILDRRDGPFIFGAVERILEEDEQIFTSMDSRPITTARMRLLDGAKDAAMIGQLQDIAREVYVELDLETLIRLDVRSDAEGRMHVLEGNPKPDLKAPPKDETSLVCEGLAEHGMSYDDLILSLLADRLDVYFSQRRGSVTRLSALLR